ncbi:MAG: hypothetical protein WDZ59_17195 [Pirellulales bacterium]
MLKTSISPSRDSSDIVSRMISLVAGVSFVVSEKKRTNGTGSA